MNTQVNQVLQRAKKSLKKFSPFEKVTLAKARTLVKIPSSAVRKELTRERILASLKRVGVATQSDLNTLQQKILKLESSLRTSKTSSKPKVKSAKAKRA